MNEYSSDMCAALLFTTRLGMEDSKRYPAPFSLQRWRSIVQRLTVYQADEMLLLYKDQQSIADVVGEKNAVRILALRNGRQLRNALHAIAAQGIGLLFENDENYPRALFALEKDRPPILYFRGEAKLLQEATGRIGIVGTRDADADSLRFARELALSAAKKGYATVSGGALGVDAEVHHTSMKSGGASVFVLPYGLQCTAALRWLEHVTTTHLFLSEQEPTTIFSAPNALLRNRMIYALGKPTVVISSHLRKGGSWSGATDALRRNFSVYVRNVEDDGALQALVTMGAHRLPIPDIEHLQC